MKIWESDVTSFDRNINSILNEISKEFSEYFKEHHNKICVLWKMSPLDYQFTQDSLNFSPEDLNLINRKTVFFDNLITNKDFDKLLDSYDGPFGKIDKFYDFINSTLSD